MNEKHKQDYIEIGGGEYEIIKSASMSESRGPRLMMSTTSWMRDHSERVGDFIRDSFGVWWNAKAWVNNVTTLQRLIRWFFNSWEGLGWVTTCTEKIRANTVVVRQGGTAFDEPDDNNHLGIAADVEFGFGLPVLPIDMQSFAPLGGSTALDTELAQFVRRRIVNNVDGGQPSLSFDYSLFRTEQGSDDEFFGAGYVPVSTISYDGQEYPAYSCWHVICCFKCGQWPSCITHLHITLHPGYMRIIALTTTSRPLGVGLKQHPIECDMLQDERAQSFGAAHDQQ